MRVPLFLFECVILTRRMCRSQTHILRLAVAVAQRITIPPGVGFIVIKSMLCPYNTLIAAKVGLPIVKNP